MTLANPSLQQMREELRVSGEFLERYNRPGPRYTSYPTAPVWNDSFGADDLEQAVLQRRAAPGRPEVERDRGGVEGQTVEVDAHGASVRDLLW